MSDTSNSPGNRFLFLPADWKALEEFIARLSAQIREQKLISAEAVNQSSESWHDNYPFEEAQRQLKALLVQRGEFSKMRELGEVVEPPTIVESVTFGTTVSYRNRTDSFDDRVTIGSHHVFSEELRDDGVISYNSPVARILMGGREGEVAKGEINGRMVELEIRSVVPWNEGKEP